jgi:hypothetical protein
VLPPPFDPSSPPVEIRFIPTTYGRFLMLKASQRHRRAPTHRSAAGTASPTTSATGRVASCEAEVLHKAALLAATLRSSMDRAR